MFTLHGLNSFFFFHKLNNFSKKIKTLVQYLLLSTLTRVQAGWPGNLGLFFWGVGIFLFSIPLNCISHRYQGIISIEVKWWGHEADICLPHSAEIKNVGSHTTTPCMFFRDWCVIRNRNSYLLPYLDSQHLLFVAIFIVLLWKVQLYDVSGVYNLNICRCGKSCLHTHTHTRCDSVPFWAKTGLTSSCLITVRRSRMFWSQWLTMYFVLFQLGVWYSCTTIATTGDGDADRSCLTTDCDTNVSAFNNSQLATIYTSYGCRNHHWPHTDNQYGDRHSW